MYPLLLLSPYRWSQDATLSQVACLGNGSFIPCRLLDALLWLLPDPEELAGHT